MIPLSLIIFHVLTFSQTPDLSPLTRKILNSFCSFDFSPQQECIFAFSLATACRPFSSSDRTRTAVQNRTVGPEPNRLPFGSTPRTESSIVWFDLICDGFFIISFMISFLKWSSLDAKQFDAKSPFPMQSRKDSRLFSSHVSTTEVTIISTREKDTTFLSFNAYILK